MNNITLVRIYAAIFMHIFLQIQAIDTPLVIVAIAGLYRTGKSYIMNMLARADGSGSLQGVPNQKGEN